MKIGILTYHFGTNFGGQLQCFALSQTLKNLGHKVVVINYLPYKENKNIISDCIYSLRILKANKTLNGCLMAMQTLALSHVMRKNFKLFQDKYINIGHICNLNNFNQYYDDLDAVIVGSDQVWSPAHHKSGAYFFNFNPPFNKLKISYAPCCAINKVASENINLVKNLLIKFNAISVRNHETQNFIRDLLHREVPIVADPTLLYDFRDFHSSKVPNKKYVLVYILGHEIKGGHQVVIDYIKQKYQNYPIYVISQTNGKHHYFKWATKTFMTLDPVDWVAFIKNASFVYTDSFHGTIFSLKFHVPFIAYYTEAIRASRFKDLQTTFNLNNIISDANDINSTIQVENNVDDIINKLKIKSIEFIQKALH